MRRAEENFAANSQSVDIDGPGPVEGEWVFGRDGFLTLRDPAGNWHTGCSLPSRAAQAMLKKMPVSGRVACFLGPTHAAQIRVALDQLRFDQAIIVIMPGARDFQIAMHCADFTSDLERHRVFFAAGENWADQLATVFQANPGLAPPSHFIRLPLLGESACDHLMREAQRVFAEVANRRAEEIKQTWRNRRAAPGESPRACVIAPGSFRLWDDAGQSLLSLFDDPHSITRLDPDDPASTSPLALARAAASCDAIVSVNMYRGDAAKAVPDAIPWITWVTNARMPSVKSAGPRDRLLVLDDTQKRRAIADGWNAERVDVAGWLTPVLPDALNPNAALIADLPSLDCPEELADFSSLKLMWDRIRDELIGDPGMMHDVDDYLAARRRQLSIGESGFPRTIFIDGLITPAIQVGWASALIRAKAPLRIFGRGWDEFEWCAAHSRGPVETREQLECAIAQAGCLIDAWPFNSLPHPIRSCGRAVVRPFGKTLAQVAAAIRSPQFAPADTPEITRESIDRALRRALET